MTSSNIWNKKNVNELLEFIYSKNISRTQQRKKDFYWNSVQLLSKRVLFDEICFWKLDKIKQASDNI